MNKIFTKLACSLSLAALVAGAGAAIASGVNVKGVKADAGDTYTQVTDASTLASGDSLLIVCESKGDALSTTQNSNNRGVQSITISDHSTTVVSGVQEIALSGSAGAWVLTAGDVQLSGVSGKNYLKNGSDTWTIAISGGNATITSAASSRIIKRNSSSALYGTYASGQTDVQLYKKGGGGGGGGEDDPVLQSIAVSDEKTAYNVGDEFVKPTVTATYDKGEPQDVTASANFTGYNMDVAGDYTVTVSYGGKTTTYDISVTDPAVGDVLYSCDFRTATAYGYTKNKEFTLSEKNWVASISQVASSVFYLGTNTNTSNVPHGVLNNNESFADVVSALKSEDSAYSSNYDTAHAYAMRFENSYSNVGKIQLNWAGANNGFQVYIFGDHGDGLVLLQHKEAENGTGTPGFISWTASSYGEDFESIVIVARPGASGSVATSKNIRFTTFTIYEGESAATIDTAIYDSTKEEGPFTVYIGNTTALFYYNISVEPSTYIDNANWVSSDPTIFDVSGESSDTYYYHGRGLKEGQVTLTASLPGYKTAEAVVNVIPDPTLPEMEIWDSTWKVNSGSSGYNWDDEADLYWFYAHPAGDTEKEAGERTILGDVTWTSSDETVATVTTQPGGQGSITTLKPGQTTLTATRSGYQPVSVTISIVAGVVSEISVSGSMSKTSYTDKEAWDPSGFVVKAIHGNTGWEDVITSEATWTYDPASPAEGVTSVVATAHWNDGEDDYYASSAAQVVTVTVQHAGTEDDPFTVAEGIAKAVENGTTAKGPFFVKGVISKKEAWNSSYPNITYWISEDGTGSDDPSKTIECFRGKYIGNTNVTAANEGEFAVGSTVVVRGNLVNYNNVTPEFNAGNYPISIVAPETGDVDVTFEPSSTSFEIGDSGTFTATSETAGAVFTWSVDDSSVLSVDESTGEFEALALGNARVTVTASAGGKEGSTFVDFVVNGADYITVDEAYAIAASLPSGKTSDYYVYVEGFVKEFATSVKDDKPRGFDISNKAQTTKIMVYTNVDPYSDFVDGLDLGDCVRVKANVCNYSGTYELTSPVRDYIEKTSISFAYELLEQTDAVCKDYDDVTDNSEAIEAFWDDLKTLYTGLNDAQKADLVDPSSRGCGQTVLNAVARYDYLVAKYKLENFITGRSPHLTGVSPIVEAPIESNNLMVIITVIALTSVSSIAVLLVIKRRKAIR